MSIADRKDSDKYAKRLEGQLKETAEQNRELEARFDAQKDKLAEVSKHNAKLSAKFVEFQDTILSLEEQNTKLRESNSELTLQTTQLQGFLRERCPNCFKKIVNRKNEGFSPSPVEDVSITDISVDDPQGKKLLVFDVRGRKHSPPLYNINFINITLIIICF